MTISSRFIRSVPWALAALFALPTGHAEARQNLAMEPFQGRKIRIDGSLGDWPAHLDALDVKIQGSGVEASALVGYDDSNLYFALRTNTGSIVRQAKPGPGQDHATLELSVPAAQGEKARTHTVDFYPGDPGKLGGAVLVDGKTITSAEIVEFEKDQGFDLEARVPWSAIPGANRVRVGLRGRVSFFDATAPGKVTSALGTSSKGTLMPLTSSAETGLLDALVGEKGLRPIPAREAYGELTGGGTLERVALYGNFLTIVGPDYRGGQEFFAVALDVNSASQIQRLELFDLNQDGRDEIILEKRIAPSPSGYRQVVSVLEVSKDGVPAEIFLAEVAIVTEAGKIENELKLTRSGGKAALVIAQGKESGFEQGSFREPRLGEGIPSALLPWDPVESRRYVYRGKRLELEEETPSKTRGKTKPVSRASTENVNHTAGARPSAAAGPPTQKPTGSNLERLYALYKKSKSSVGPIRGEFWEDVAEDERTERVVWQDRDLLVLGDGFQGGTKFAALTLPVKDPEDVLHVSLVEVTGDGKLDIVVHALLHAKAGDVSKNEPVVRQVVLLYSLQAGRLAPIFAAEVGRSLGKKQIVAGFRVLENNGRPVVELTPGRALGFTSKTYPFQEDPNPEAPTGATIRPILLPWSATKSRRFAFSAGELREL
jgi:hypothetical protein